MAKRKLPDVTMRLRAPSVDFWVDVRLRSFGDRWMAVADISGEPEMGLGSTARQALTAALSPLGPKVAAAFLADPQLLDVTRRIRSKRQRRTES